MKPTQNPRENALYDLLQMRLEIGERTISYFHYPTAKQLELLTAALERYSMLWSNATQLPLIP